MILNKKFYLKKDPITNRFESTKPINFHTKQDHGFNNLSAKMCLY